MLTTLALLASLSLAASPADSAKPFVSKAHAGSGFLDTFASFQPDTRGNYFANAGVGLGVFAFEHLRIGLSGSYTAVFPDGSRTGAYSIGGRVFGHLWFPFSERFALFVGAFGGVNYNHSDTTDPLGELFDNGKSVVVHFGPTGGLSLFLAPNVAFEPTVSVGFRHTDFQNPVFDLSWHLEVFF